MTRVGTDALSFEDRLGFRTEAGLFIPISSAPASMSGQSPRLRGLSLSCFVCPISGKHLHPLLIWTCRHKTATSPRYRRTLDWSWGEWGAITRLVVKLGFLGIIAL